MQIEDHSVILAPGALHLALYEEIYRQKGNCLDINVLTPEAYIASRLETPKEQVLPTMYAYKQKLEQLDSENVFYDSRGDYEFLRACHDFIGWMQLYKISDLPVDTRKDKDLKAVLELLRDIPLWQKEAADLSWPEADSIYILDTQYPEQTGVLLKRMVDAGAHRLAQPAAGQKVEYWSASNPRKEMELAADEIIDKSIPAEQVFIALADSIDSRVLDQVFNARGIPHTFLHDPVPSKILREFQVIYAYILDPTDENMRQILREMYYRQSTDLRRYLELFPQGSNLKDMAYEENPIISELEFQRLQSLEAQAEPWQQTLDQIRSWDHTSIVEIATMIQEQNPKPTEDDIKVFDSILNVWSSVAPFIHNKEDLKLFVHHLHNVHPSATLHTMSGVLIGAPKEISCLRPVVFYIGADSAHFPGLSMHGGIFDEDYLARTSFPPLQERLDFQKQELFSRLDQPETLYVIIPQSNYEGDPIESSFEMNMWAEKMPAFMRVNDPSVWNEPDFSLSEERSLEMFAPNQVFQAGVRSLQVFQDCPLKHMLRFGLRLKTSYGFFEDLRVRPEFIHKLFFNAKMELGKNYEDLTREDVIKLTAMEMDFPTKVFASQKQVLQILESEYTEKIWELIQVLKTVNSQWNLAMVASDYDIHLSEKIDNLDVEITGSLTPSNKAPFSLMDPADLNTPGALPKASLALGMNLKPTESKATRISYGRGSASAQVHPIADTESENAFVTDFLKSSISAQNLEDVKTGYADVVKKKIPTYDQKQADLKNTAESFVLSLSSGCIAPEHKKGACEYCTFSSICRNGAREK